MAEVQDIRSVLQESMQGLEETRGNVTGFHQGTQEAIDEIGQLGEDVEQLIARSNGLKGRLEELGGNHGATIARIREFAQGVGSVATGAPILGRTSENLSRLGDDMVSVGGVYESQSTAFGGISQVLLELKTGLDASKGLLSSLIEPQKGALPVEGEAMGRAKRALENYDRTMGQEVPSGE